MCPIFLIWCQLLPVIPPGGWVAALKSDSETSGVAIAGFTSLSSVFTPKRKGYDRARNGKWKRHINYSKSQTFVQKFNSDKTPSTFSPKFFLTIFLVKSKLSTAKKSKITTFSRVFHPKKSTIFSGNQSWIFGQKMKISNSVNSTELISIWRNFFFSWVLIHLFLDWTFLEPFCSKVHITEFWCFTSCNWSFVI